MTKDQEKVFTYSTRKEYERALAELVSSGDDDAYDQLIEEYLSFCEGADERG